VTHDSGSAAARVKPGSNRVDPNALTTEQVSKLGSPAHRAALATGSVTIDTVYRVISDHALNKAEKGRWTRMIGAQTDVLNESHAGETAATAAATPSSSARSASTEPSMRPGTR
jgi:hypothetical protein